MIIYTDGNMKIALLRKIWTLYVRQTGVVNSLLQAKGKLRKKPKRSAYRRKPECREGSLENMFINPTKAKYIER